MASLALAWLCPPVPAQAAPAGPGASAVSAAPRPQARWVVDAVDAAVARYRLPGIAVGVIEDGRVVAVETRGELSAGSGQPVRADTLFKIASNSKAMTAGVLARLVDQGRLRWDDPVTRHLPQFRMYDPWVTANMQVRDLLVHNSGLGLGAGDLMLWPEPNDFTRADIIAGLAHLRPVTSFRAGYAYDNLLYVVAGEVAAAAAGLPYDELVRRELFAPLGMDGCRVGQWPLAAAGSVAQPHRRAGDDNLPVREDGAVVPDAPSMAAGGIRCGLEDMLRWVGMWLDPQHPWLSPAQRRAVWTGHMPMPVSARMRDWDNSHFHAYGYGWRLSDVDGQWKVAHTGTLMGMYSSVILLPDRRTGIVILINGEGEAARTALGQALLKHYTAPGVPPAQRDVAHYAGLLEAERSARQARQPLPDTTHRRPARAGEAAALLGVWRDPWFGEVSICPRRGGIGFVSARSPRMAGRLMRVDRRWLLDWNDDSVEAEAWLHPPDDTATLRLDHVDPDADFSYDYADLAFVRDRDCP